MKHVDVLIVGSGPAGASAAFALASAGFSALMLDKKQVVGVPNHCGEGISEWCLQEAGFPEGEPWMLNQVKGARLIFPNQKKVYFTQKGYCIDRPGFDQALARRAVDAGAELLLSCKVASISRIEKGWKIVDHEKREFTGSYLIGSGGARCPVAFQLGQRPYLLPAFQYKFKISQGFDKVDPDWLDFYHSASFPGGYAWIFPRRNEVAIGGGSNRDLKGNLHAVCEKYGFSPSEASIKEGGPIPFLKKPLEIAFPRALLAGDSGGFTFPLTKGGIHGAIWSGKLAGQSISEALKNGNPEAIQAFLEKVKKHPARRSRHLMMPQTFFGFTDPMFNSIGNIMDGKEFTQMEFGNLFRELRQNPSYQLLKGVFIGGIIQHHIKKTYKFAW